MTETGASINKYKVQQRLSHFQTREHKIRLNNCLFVCLFVPLRLAMVRERGVDWSLPQGSDRGSTDFGICILALCLSEHAEARKLHAIAE